MTYFKVGKHPSKRNRFCILHKVGPGNWQPFTNKAYNTRDAASIALQSISV